MKQILVLLCIAYGSLLLAEERIHFYGVDIQVLADSSLEITETIEVTAEGRNIRRGIYRDFPTRYRDRLGNRVKVRFEVVSVKRDGRTEAWHQESIGNGERIYIGSANHFLQPGRYRYTLMYQTNRQLGFFDSHDELYFNAIGTEWAFPIDQAEIHVMLPQAVSAGDVTVESYIGAFGSRQSGFQQDVSADGAAWFKSSRALSPGEGLTIVVGWPKGYVTEPSQAQKLKWLLQDNLGVLLAISFTIGLLVLYLWLWIRAGRDPSPGTIIPLFRPPDGISPAGSRYVSRMFFDHKAFTAAIISLAVKGALRIEQQDRSILKDKYYLHKEPDFSGEGLSKGETKVLDALFRSSDKLELVNKNHATFQRARRALKKALQREHKGRLFKDNAYYWIFVVAVSLFALVILLVTKPPVYALAIYSAAAMIMHAVFYALLRVPTMQGRKVMDQILGLKRYLQTAEVDRLNRMRSPKLTPEVFEAFLPYAFALGVENQWSDALKQVLQSAAESDQQGSYQPHWYQGGDFGGINFLNEVSGNLNSGLNSALSSASTPPGSSSGSGGGGFSGGGGGGGGGGGW